MKTGMKIGWIGLIILAIMIYEPSMLGLAQEFFGDMRREQTIEVEGSPYEVNKVQDLKVDESLPIEDETKEEVDIENEEDNETEETDEKVGEVNQAEVIPPSSEVKKIFLTFDDGPSSTTTHILDILDTYNIKASFFTVGTNVERNPEIVRDTYERGHMILPHTYTHEYSIYTSFETYYKDLEFAKSSVENILDIDLPYILRFPGGSSNESSFKFGGKQFMPQLTKDMKAKGYYYIDWNVSSEDATADYDNGEKLFANVINGSKNKKFVVALFHDTARNTTMAETLPEIIEELLDQGYVFRSFRDITQEELDTMVELRLANKVIAR